MIARTFVLTPQFSFRLVLHDQDIAESTGLSTYCFNLQYIKRLLNMLLGKICLVGLI